MSAERNRNKRDTGNYGEDLACGFLEDLGYKIIERNYFYNHGEIDIVALDGNELVFVEVKYRKSLEYGPPEVSISVTKQRLIKRTAEAYLYEREIRDQACRIDFIAILHNKDEKPVINHFKNAF